MATTQQTKQPLRLYQLTDTAAQGKDRTVPGTFFSMKEKAKVERRKLNGVVDGVENLRYVVSPGPDHHAYKQ